MTNGAGLWPRDELLGGLQPAVGLFAGVCCGGLEPAR